MLTIFVALVFLGTGWLAGVRCEDSLAVGDSFRAGVYAALSTAMLSLAVLSVVFGVVP